LIFKDFVATQPKVFTFVFMRESNYPQFRKYKNNKVYFKIISDAEWEELHISGNICIVHTFVAKILPDRNYLSDMTFEYEEHWEKIEEQEYEAKKRFAGH
jgi:hypothetical protein